MIQLHVCPELIISIAVSVPAVNPPLIVSVLTYVPVQYSGPVEATDMLPSSQSQFWLFQWHLYHWEQQEWSGQHNKERSVDTIMIYITAISFISSLYPYMEISYLLLYIWVWLTWDWMGVGVENSDFLISSINGGSKRKCANETQGLGMLYPLTCRNKTNLTISLNQNVCD